MNSSQYITGIQHIGIPTNDMEKTVAFYTGIGFEIAYDTINEAAGGEKVVFLKLGNVIVEAYENHQAAEQIGAIDHLALDVTDIEAVWEALRRDHTMLDDAIQFLPFWEKGVRFFTILGPNKEKVEFSQRL